MNWKDTLKLAFQNVRTNLLRSVLTLTIIAVGLMALVGILTAIDGIIYSMGDNFSKMGTNSFTIKPTGHGMHGRRRGRKVKQGEDINLLQAKSFKKSFDFQADVSISLFCTGMAKVSHKDQSTNPNIPTRGIDDSYFKIHNVEIEHGRNFTPNEDYTSKTIIGFNLVKKLFHSKPNLAIGNTILVNSHKFKIIGTLKEQGSKMGESEDNNLYIPLGIANNIWGGPNKNYEININAHSIELLQPAIAEATLTFRKVRRLKPGKENDFLIRKSDSLVGMLKDNTFQLRMGAIGIGLVTLFGAAIGLMNIMLVSVTERTKEIGLIKALGATKNNILTQFLAEATIICLIGGIIGIILGILSGVALSYYLESTFHMPWAWSILGLIISIIVGLVAGIYPASQAAKLDPIESLRHE